MVALEIACECRHATIGHIVLAVPVSNMYYLKFVIKEKATWSNWGNWTFHVVDSVYSCSMDE